MILMVMQLHSTKCILSEKRQSIYTSTSLVGTLLIQAPNFCLVGQLCISFQLGKTAEQFRFLSIKYFIFLEETFNISEKLDIKFIVEKLTLNELHFLSMNN